MSLVVYYRTMALESHPWNQKNELTYKNYLLKEKLLGIDLKMVWKALFTKDYFIIAGWNCLTYIFVISILTIRNKSFAIFSDTPRVRKESIKQYLKIKWLKYIFRKQSNASLLVTGEIGVKTAKKILGIQSEKIYNFPFATNHDLFASDLHSSISLYNTYIKFISVGRIVFSHKGQDVAIKAFRLIKERGHENFIYFIAGTGEDLEKLKNMILEYNLEKNIVLLGWKQFHELPALFNSVHFTIHSSYDDPFPNAILESLSCGTPVIGSDKAGSAVERIVTGKNGFIHSAGDVVDLADKIEQVINMTDAEYQMMRVNSRKMAERWGVDHNIGVLNQLLKLRT